jgi:rod shape-determining protein MreD
MHNWLVILATLFLAICLSLMPIPSWFAWMRPNFILMTLLFWTITLPDRINVSIAWLMGIISDLLTGTLLGEHALGFIITIYFADKMHTQLRMHPLLQQALSIGLFTLIYQLIIYCIQGMLGDLPQSDLYWLPTISSMLIWPWFAMLLKDCKRRFNVA